MKNNLGIDLQKFIFIDKKPKTWRASTLSNVLLFVSILFSGALWGWGGLNVSSVDLAMLVGFDDFYVNFVVGFLLFSLLAYWVNLLILGFAVYFSYGVGVCSIYGKNNIRDYFAFWFAVRNFALGLVYLLVLLVPALLDMLMLINMLLTIAAFVCVFFDVKKNVVGDVIALFSLKRMANVLIIYYLIICMFEFVGVV